MLPDVTCLECKTLVQGTAGRLASASPEQEVDLQGREQREVGRLAVPCRNDAGTEKHSIIPRIPCHTGNRVGASNTDMYIRTRLLPRASSGLRCDRLPGGLSPLMDGRTDVLAIVCGNRSRRLECRGAIPGYRSNIGPLLSLSLTKHIGTFLKCCVLETSFACECWILL